MVGGGLYWFLKATGNIVLMYINGLTKIMVPENKIKPVLLYGFYSPILAVPEVQQFLGFHFNPKHKF